MLTCELCDYGTERVANLNRHLLSKKHLKNVECGKLEGNNIKKFHCNYCDTHFKDKYDAQKHQGNSDPRFNKNPGKFDGTMKHIKAVKKLFDQQNKTTNTKQDKIKLMVKIRNEAWTKERIHVDRKIKNRVKPTTKPKYIFTPEDFEDYCHLSHEQMKTLIISFVQYIDSKKANIENYINYSDWIKDDDDDTTNLYIELYELIVDPLELQEILNI